MSASADNLQTTIAFKQDLSSLKAMFQKGFSKIEGGLSLSLERSLRKARLSFLTNHSKELYRETTQNYRKRRRISELLSESALVYPELFSSAGSPEGNSTDEISQGAFLRGVLRCEQSGLHLANTMLMPEDKSLQLLDSFQRYGDLKLTTVHLQRIGTCAHLTLNNPEHLNSEDDQLVADIETAVDLALLDENVKVALVRGGFMSHPKYKNQRVFSSGINLKKLHQKKISFSEFILKREFGYISKIAHGLFNPDSLSPPDISVNNRQKPWIAVVDSFAIGGGLQWLFVFDRVFAVEKAFFSLPAANEGIIPGAANLRLPAIFGPRLSRQILLEGKQVDCSSAEGFMLCDRVVSGSEIDIVLEDAIKGLSQPATLENRKMLNLNLHSRTAFIKYMAEFCYQQVLRLNSQDVAEAASRWNKGTSGNCSGEKGASAC